MVSYIGMNEVIASLELNSERKLENLVKQFQSFSVCTESE
jgi:hypothetical protein